MQINDKPFSIYDFIGYLIPGIFGIYSAVFIFKYILYGSLSISIFPESEQDYNEEKIISIILFYIVGHLLSFFSSMSVEKYSVWTLGYPSEYLFNKRTKKGFYKECFSYEDIISKGAFLRLICRLIIRSIVWLLLLPVAIGDFLARKIFRLHDLYARPFEDSLLVIVEKKCKKIIKKDFKNKKVDTTGDTFRIIYHYSIEKSINHINKMQNYVALYGFTRTLSFIGCIMFWECIMLILYKYIMIKDILMFSYLFFIRYGFILFLIFFITFFLYWDFNKFYRKFSMEAYLGAVVARKNE